MSADSSNDGVLYTYEISELKLNTDLVTLSACETGLGTVKKGEGTYGLMRSFIKSGASNLLVSLWKVSDESTKDTMVNFYDNLIIKRKDKDHSLSKAKRRLIESKKYSHPYYWSPFVLYQNSTSKE